MRKLLLIFAKEPKRGLVKTRLARKVGDIKACEIYRTILIDIVNNVRCDNCYETRILCTPESNIDNLKSLLGFDNISHQKGENLSKRLGFAFEESFENGYENVVAIGSDSPFIDRDVINDGFKRLEKDDFVIGPACDGGYYLIGLKRCCNEIFDGIEWSTKNVFSQTLDKIKKLKYSCSVMERMHDVDVLDDILAVKRIYENLTSVKKNRSINVYNIIKDINQT